MHLLEALLKLRLTPEEPPPDGAVVLEIVSKAPAQPAADSGRLSDRCSNGCAKAAANSSKAAAHGWFNKLRTVGATASPSFVETPLLPSLPPFAASLVWADLAHAEKRSLRLVQPDICTVFSRAVGSLEVSDEVLLLFAANC
jgi:hypothetical protein